MSSKGKQAVTNDGSDSKYREKVADHYKGTFFLYVFKNKYLVESKTAKASLKWYLLFTFMANAFVAAHYFMKKYKVQNRA